MNTISKIRAHLGVTQVAMAEALDVTQGNVSNYERGQAMPPHVAGRLIAYAGTLGVQLTYDEIYAAEYSPQPAARLRRTTDHEPEAGRSGRSSPSAEKLLRVAPPECFD